MRPYNLHTHTTFCDGDNTPEELAAAALAAGCEILAFPATATPALTSGTA